MTDEEWSEAFDYLVGRLGEQGFGDTGAEIQTLSAVPIAVRVDPRSFPDGAKLSDRRELGEYSVRQRTAQERFGVALRVLEARLVELPALLDRVSTLIERELATITFEPDLSLEVDFDSEGKSFTFEQLPDKQAMDRISAVATALMSDDEPVRENVNADTE